MYELKNPVILAPGIFLYDDVIDNSQKNIELALQDNKWLDGEIYASDDQSNIVTKTDNNLRKCKNLTIYHNYYDPVEWFYLYQTIWRYADQYAKTNNIRYNAIEPLQVVHYEKNNDFYDIHSDYGAGTNRSFSAVLYLNNVINGGETYFDKFDISVKPEPGRLILFPSNYPYTHAAKPPVSNDKFVVVTWFRSE